MELEHIPLRTIVTLSGLYELLKVQLRLRNTDQTFQRFIHQVLRDIPFVCAYLDDVFIARPTMQDHINYFYYSGFSDYCLHLYCYIHNVSVGMSSSLLLVFLIEFRTLHRTSIHILYLITCSDSVIHNRVQVLYIPVLLLACSQDWTLEA